MVRITFAFWKDQPLPVTVLLTLTLVPLLLSLVFCSLSISMFAKEFNHMKMCFLYTTNYGLKAGSDSYCEFVIVSQSFVLILVTSLMIAILIMLFIRFKSIIYLNLLILPTLAVVSFLLSFSASVILSDGLAKTCNAVEEGLFNQVNCIDFFRYIDPSGYNGVHNLVLSWIETGFIVVVVIIAFVYMGLGIPRCRNASSDPLLVNRTVD